MRDWRKVKKGIGGLLLLLLAGCANARLISEGGNWAGAAAAGSGGYNAPVKIEGSPAPPPSSP